MSKEGKKICPLSFSATPNQDESRSCYEKACGWWDEFTGHCAILSISRHGAEGSFEVLKKEQKADREGT